METFRRPRTYNVQSQWRCSAFEQESPNRKRYNTNRQAEHNNIQHVRTKRGAAARGLCPSPHHGALSAAASTRARLDFSPSDCRLCTSSFEPLPAPPSKPVTRNMEWPRLEQPLAKTYSCCIWVCAAAWGTRKRRPRSREGTMGRTRLPRRHPPRRLRPPPRRLLLPVGGLCGLPGLRGRH